jgi:hypothetical protein
MLHDPLQGLNVTAKTTTLAVIIIHRSVLVQVIILIPILLSLVIFFVLHGFFLLVVFSTSFSSPAGGQSLQIVKSLPIDRQFLSLDKGE